MKHLNLTATNTAQQRIKEYLEQNVSDIQADKINNGVRIVQDGLPLISKKTLDGFMSYATEEARKIAEKGARSACIEDSVVYGWAIHYFEEDSIFEKLYNEDGTEYKGKVKPHKPTKTAEKPPVTPKAEAPKQTPAPAQKTAQKPPKATTSPEQVSIFDLF